jgi:hypothetical protein
MATVSFKAEILPLFTPMDIQHMKEQSFPLDDYDFMSQPDNASSVYDQVSTGAMPPSWSGEDPWSDEKVSLFKEWMEGGYQP